MTYPNRMDLTVTIDGNDRTDYIVPDTLSIRSVLTSRIDTCKFVMEDAGTVEPTEWDEITIIDGADKVFGGYVLSKTQKAGASVGLDFTVSCADYAALLDKVIVKEEYDTQTDAYVLNHLFNKYLPEIDSLTYVAVVKTHTKLRLNRMTLREAVDVLAEYAGADWFIDYDKSLHFFPTLDSTAPYELSQSPDLSTTFPFAKLKKHTEGAAVVNRVEVVGGDYLSDDQTIYIAGTGQDTRIALPFRMREPTAGGGLDVDRNDGTEGSPSWTAMTIKVGYLNTLGGTTEAIHYFQEKVLEQQNNWPNLPNAVRVQGRIEVPLRARVGDQASRDLYGRWFDDVINAPDITDKETAKLAGQGVLGKNAMGQVAVSCMVWEPGLIAGQTLTIDTDLHGISDEDFLIQSVEARVGINGNTVFDLELGVFDPDLIDVIVKLARRSKSKPIWREDEVLDDVLLEDESLALTEGSTSVTSDSAPYHWGPGGANPFDWGFGVWG